MNRAKTFEFDGGVNGYVGVRKGVSARSCRPPGSSKRYRLRTGTLRPKQRTFP